MTILHDPDGADMIAFWRLRKVREEIRPASWFLANERNWRTHPQSQINALTASLDQLGWIDEVKVNLRTSERWGTARDIPVLLDGHARIVLALRKDERTAVPVTYYDLDPDEETAALLLLDPIATMAGADSVKLSDLLQEYVTDDADVQTLLHALAGTASLSVPEIAIPEAFPEVRDDSMQTEYCCPKCGYEWSGPPK